MRGKNLLKKVIHLGGNSSPSTDPRLAIIEAAVSFRVVGGNSKERCVLAMPDQLFFSFLLMKVSATGMVARLVGASVSILILAVAWRIVSPYRS
jgi:hypothetical protein